MRGVLFAALLAAVLYGLSSWTAPCSAPITYRLGDIDSRFGMSRNQVQSALRDAEAIWEATTGRNLLEYAEDGRLPVNFFYDNRQLTAQEILRRKGTIERTNESAAELKAEFDAAHAKFEAAKTRHAAEQAAHEARVAAYNRNVRAWNARGGAPPAELAAMRREEAGIDSSASALEKNRLAINSLAARANSLSERYNELVGEMNADVDAINTNAGREFKQGLFTENSKGMRIDIFEFIDREDLVHVLAHELGHALGLGHNDNPDSIMYGLNSTRSNTLAREDLMALRERCGI